MLVYPSSKGAGMINVVLLGGQSILNCTSKLFTFQVFGKLVFIMYRNNLTEMEISLRAIVALVL